MLFTVSATFSDFSAAYEQYEAKEPSEALASFILKAESLSAYDLGLRAIAAQSEGHKLTHVAGGKHGLWIWHLTIRMEYEEIALYGGCIVQTDPTAPIRTDNAA